MPKPKSVPIQNDGLIRGMSEEEYDKIKAERWSRVKAMARSPFHFKNYQSIATPVFDFGRAFHSLCLEGKRIHAKASDAEKVRKGKIIVTDEQDVALDRMCNNVHLHPFASKLLEQAEKEVVIVREHSSGIKIKHKIDAVNKNSVVELKSTADASPGAFKESIKKYLYHGQAAWNYDGLQTSGYLDPDASDLDFFWIAVEKFWPHAVACYTIHPLLMQEGRLLYGFLMDRIHECKRNDEWPTYGGGGYSVL